MHCSKFASWPAVACLALLGCQPAAQSPPPPTASPVPVAVAPAPKAAEPNSFNEVAARLDRGGNLFLYLSTESWMRGLSAKLGQIRDLVLDRPEFSEQDGREIRSVFAGLKALLARSGVEELSGVGMSSFAVKPGFYRGKMLLHHYPGKDDGLMWGMLGRQAHPLNVLELLPGDTAVALSMDLNLPLVWRVLEEELNRLGGDEMREFVQGVPAQFQQLTGLEWGPMLQSLGGEYSLVLTLNPDQPMPVPIPGKPSSNGTQSPPLTIPEPGLMLLVKVQDDLVYDRLVRLMEDNPEVLKVEEGGLRMQTLPMPLPLPLTVRPTLARFGDHLILASTDQLVRDLVAVAGGKGPRLKDAEEFQQLSQGLPEEGNQFHFVSRRFTQVLLDLQARALEGSGGLDAEQQTVIRRLFNLDSPKAQYAVTVLGDDGMYVVSQGNQDPGLTLGTAAAAVPAGLLGAIAVPNFIKARSTAQRNTCVANLKQLDGAKQQWALENRKLAGDTPGEAELVRFLFKGHLPVCPNGGHYTLNSVQENPECSIVGHSLNR